MSKLTLIANAGGVEIGPDDWPYYLWPEIIDVNASYAFCLSNALRRAVAEIRDPTLDLQHHVNGGSASLTKGALGLREDEVKMLEDLSSWCDQGGFRVRMFTEEPTWFVSLSTY